MSPGTTTQTHDPGIRLPGGAGLDALLPASIPGRFFAAALLFHGLAWGVLAVAAGHAAGFAGGLGLPLAALHLATLGVLATTAIGALCQLLPVAAQAPLRALWPCRLTSWLLLPGVPVLAWGMATGDPGALGLGGLACGAALAVFTAAVGHALHRAGRRRRRVDVVSTHLWGALAALFGAAGLGLAVLGDFVHGHLADHQTVALLHLIVAAYGFLGLLILGFGQVLVPMFLLSLPPPRRLAFTALALAVTGLALALAGWFAPAVLVGLGAAGIHLATMAALMRNRVHKALGPSFVLVRLSWVLLPVSLLLGGALVLDRLPAWGPALFGFVLVFGWLLSLVLGILQRILPFLAALHIAAISGHAPAPSDLGSAALLKAQTWSHIAAVPMVSLGIVTGQPMILAAGALIGAVGAGAFLAYGGDLLLGVRDRIGAAARPVRPSAWTPP